MRILYQFPLSHFCEKARWLLDHKELDFVAQNRIPGVHRAFAQLKTGQNNLPILKDQEGWIADSTKIALYLDEKYPEHALLRSDPKLRQKAFDINELANELGVCVRRWGLAHALAESDEPLEILIGEKGYLRKFQKLAKPIMKSLVSSNYQLDSENVELAKQRMDEIVQLLNDQLVENKGRYMVGDQLGLADIAVCSMLAPLLEIEGTPWEREFEHPVSEVFEQYRLELMDRPIGQYVNRIYMNERNARVDWRGI